AHAALQPEKKKPGPGGAAVKAAAAEETVQQAAEKRANASAELNRVLGEIVGDLSSVGPLQHSCRPRSLTENEAEYTVQVVKHMFKQHAVLEFRVENTVQGITLEDVAVVLTGVEPGWTELGATKINRLEYGQQTALTVVLQKNGGDDRAGALQGNFGAKLTFLVKEEGDDLGYEDEYPIEGLDVSTGDYMFPRQLPAGQFKSAWEQLTAQGVEATQKLSLTYKSLEAAVAGIIQVLNMEACEGTGKVEAGVRGHTLNLSGTFLGGHTCLVKALVGMDQNHGCVAKIACRAKSEQIAELIAKAMMDCGKMPLRIDAPIQELPVVAIALALEGATDPTARRERGQISWTAAHAEDAEQVLSSWQGFFTSGSLCADQWAVDAHRPGMTVSARCLAALGLAVLLGLRFAFVAPVGAGLPALPAVPGSPAGSAADVEAEREAAAAPWASATRFLAASREGGRAPFPDPLAVSWRQHRRADFVRKAIGWAQSVL
ncbi:unnamed protein product, partial [Prorocentrum cordatum]